MFLRLETDVGLGRHFERKVLVVRSSRDDGEVVPPKVMSVAEHIVTVSQPVASRKVHCHRLERALFGQNSAALGNAAVP